MGRYSVMPFNKGDGILQRIELTSMLMAQGRYKLNSRMKKWQESIVMATWSDSDFGYVLTMVLILLTVWIVRSIAITRLSDTLSSKVEESMNDWREFLEEVHEQNKENMELSKRREYEMYGETNECEGNDENS